MTPADYSEVVTSLDAYRAAQDASEPPESCGPEGHETHVIRTLECRRCGATFVVAEEEP